MSKVIELSKRFNHRWKADPAFEKGFDYDHPKYAGVDDDLKWAIPMMEAQNTPIFIAESRAMEERAEKGAQANSTKIDYLLTYVY